MSSTYRPRRVLLALGSALVAATLGATLTPAVAHHAQPPGPVHAGSEYGWGRAPVDYRFVGRLDHRQWKVKGHGLVRNQHGMLTLNTTHRGSVSATQVTQGHRVGRWEIRLRSRTYGRGHAYRVLTELVPAGRREQHCGASNIALESYRPHHRKVSHYIRTRPDHRYSLQRGIRLRNDQWHTFAVEITPKRISWFVDAHVVSTEKRSGARSGTPFAVRFTMQAEPGVRMQKSRMQMDWLRYWTLKNHDAKSTAAPRPTLGTYADAC